MDPATEYAIDVVIPTHNHLGLTIRSLDALYTNTRSPFHLVIVDDSVDLTPLYLTQFCKEHNNITYIHSDVPYKTGNQIFNKGFEHAKTPYLATVMNSVRVEPDWEQGPLQLMNGDPKVGVVGCKCLFPSGFIESAGIKMNKYLPCDLGRDWPGHRMGLTFISDAVQWAFAVVRVEAVKGMGMLEEGVFHGFRGWDDIDNCFCLKKAGWKVLFCGSSVGYHEPRATRGVNTPEGMQQNKENGINFYKRWGLWDEYIKQNPDMKDIHATPV